MKKNIALFIMMLSLFTGCNSPVDSPAKDLIMRVTRNSGENITPIITPSTDGSDYFELTQDGDKVLIKGNNTISIATGLNWYLKYVCGQHLTWNNLSDSLPNDLPKVANVIRKETNHKLRYYLNYCTFSYSMAFWDWERWEKELDWMATHGINLCLSITGNEVVWYNLLKRVGYSVDEINDFISGPAYMAWWQMNNLEGWGGPNSQNWYEQQEALQKKILARMKELGIEPILPGYAGMVPRNIGEKLGCKIQDPGKWCGFNRPAFLSPEDSNFDTFADMYYEEMEKLYGTVKYYSIDPFHEGGSTEGVDVPKAGSTLYNAMKRVNQDAVWVIQAWQRNPIPEMIDHLPKGDLVVLDLYSEKRPQWGERNSVWYRENGFNGHDWIQCMVLNFGRNVGLHGRMDRVINGYYDASEHKQGQFLRGVGMTSEGIENNPAMYELLYELPWRKERFTKEEWMDEYIGARYGSSDENLRIAWSILGETVYNMPVEYPGEGTVESLFCARPRLHADRVSTWGAATLFYSADSTVKAVKHLLEVADKYKDNSNYAYDVVDITRQAIADAANVVHHQYSKAYDAKDVKLCKEYSTRFVDLLQVQERLLATLSDFCVGPWLEQARNLGVTPEEKDLYEWNARTLITTWGDKVASEQGGLHDYSHREWSGILKDLHLKRWELFFDQKMKTLKGEKVDDIDYFQIEKAWAEENNTYPHPSGESSVEVAKEIYSQLLK